MPEYSKKSNHHSKKQSNSSDPQDAHKKTEEVQQIKHELVNFARTWWGQQWIHSLLDVGRPYRMQRGIQYAQEDRIENVMINPGQIFATVEGKMSPTPYRVRISFETIDEAGWQKIINNIANKAIFVIKLLENVLPEEFIDIFHQVDNSLFPRFNRNQELNATCSCPDYVEHKSLCKHIAATILYVARIIDFDPFLILKLRGKTKEELLFQLQKARSCSNRTVTQETQQFREKTENMEGKFDVPTLFAQDCNLERFTIGHPYEIGFRFTKPTPNIETLDNLGIIPNLGDPVVFEATLRQLYIIVTKEMYHIANSLENPSNDEEK